jgi:hypothetical protein
MAITKVQNGWSIASGFTAYNTTVDEIIVGANRINGLVQLEKFGGGVIDIELPITKNALIDGGTISIDETDKLVINISEAVYTIDSENYLALASSVTLSQGDVTYNRIDAIVATTGGTFEVIEGTAASIVVSPTVPRTQCLISYIYVQTGADTSGGTSTYAVIGDYFGTSGNTLTFDNNGLMIETDIIRYDIDNSSIVIKDGFEIEGGDIVINVDSISIETTNNGLYIAEGEAFRKAGIYTSSGSNSADFIMLDSSEDITGIKLSTTISGSTSYINMGTKDGIIDPVDLNPRFDIYSDGNINVYSDDNLRLGATNNIDITANNIEINTSVDFGVSSEGAYISTSDYLNLAGENSVNIDSVSGTVSITAAANASVAASSELYLIGNDFVSVESTTTVGIQGTENVYISTKLYSNNGEVINIGNTDELNLTPTTGVTIQSTGDINIESTDSINISSSAITMTANLGNIDIANSDANINIDVVEGNITLSTVNGDITLDSNQNVIIPGELSLAAGATMSDDGLGNFKISKTEGADVFDIKLGTGTVYLANTGAVNLNTIEIGD